MLKAVKVRGGYKVNSFFEHTVNCGRNLITKYNRTYNYAVERAATEIISNRITSTVRDVIAYVKGSTRIELSWDQGNYFKKKALANLSLDESTSYREIENYFNIIKEVYAGSNCTLTVDNGKYISGFISLAPWIYIFLGCKRQMITLDATFLTGKRGGACLIAVFMDCSGKITPLGVGIYETEDSDSWRHFLHCLITAVPEIEV